MSKTVAQAEADLAAAKAALLQELRQDGERSEGSGAQERRREAHQQQLVDAVSRCEQALSDAGKAAPGAQAA